jgi:ABC-type uncharacterized transport system substrate-binding protein
MSLLASHGFSEDAEKYSATPVLKPDGTRWKIGYLEGGYFIDYKESLKAFVEGLEILGWIEPISIPEGKFGDSDVKLWRWLSQNIESNYVEFVSDAIWSSNWEAEKRERNRRKVLQRLNRNGDIDLMIAMGTWAGQDLANNLHSTSTVIMSTSDPVASNIIKSPEDSGYDHVHAYYDPYRYEKQIRVFHDIFQFKKLGVAYEDTQAGRSYAGLSVLQKIAEKEGFEIVHCLCFNDIPDMELAFDSLLKCHQYLAPNVDAMYLTAHGALIPEKIPALLKPFEEHNVPTFSQLGTDLVKAGVLLSAVEAEYETIGLRLAEDVGRIFNGAMPRQLDQIFSEQTRLAINLEEAKKIGWDVPLEILEMADDVYLEK